MTNNILSPDAAQGFKAGNKQTLATAKGAHDRGRDAVRKVGRDAAIELLRGALRTSRAFSFMQWESTPSAHGHHDGWAGEGVRHTHDIPGFARHIAARADEVHPKPKNKHDNYYGPGIASATSDNCGKSDDDCTTVEALFADADGVGTADAILDTLDKIGAGYVIQYRGLKWHLHLPIAAPLAPLPKKQKRLYIERYAFVLGILAEVAGLSRQGDNGPDGFDHTIATQYMSLAYLYCRRTEEEATPTTDHRDGLFFDFDSLLTAFGFEHRAKAYGDVTITHDTTALVKALVLAGMVCGDPGDDKIHVLCPNRAQHSADSDGTSTSVLFRLTGAFNCKRAHCGGVTTRDLLAAARATGKPEVLAALDEHEGIAAEERGEERVLRARDALSRPRATEPVALDAVPAIIHDAIRGEKPLAGGSKLVIQVSTGGGKTRAVKQLLGPGSVYLANTVKLLEEVRGDLNARDVQTFLDVSARHEINGRSLCAYPKDIEQAQANGLNAGESVCARCPRREGCTARSPLGDRNGVVLSSHQKAHLLSDQVVNYIDEMPTLWVKERVTRADLEILQGVLARPKKLKYNDYAPVMKEQADAIRDWVDVLCKRADDPTRLGSWVLTATEKAARAKAAEFDPRAELGGIFPGARRQPKLSHGPVIVRCIAAAKDLDDIGWPEDTDEDTHGGFFVGITSPIGKELGDKQKTIVLLSATPDLDMLRAVIAPQEMKYLEVVVRPTAAITREMHYVTNLNVRALKKQSGVDLEEKIGELLARALKRFNEWHHETLVKVFAKMIAARGASARDFTTTEIAEVQRQIDDLHGKSMPNGERREQVLVVLAKSIEERVKGIVHARIEEWRTVTGRQIELRHHGELDGLDSMKTFCAVVTIGEQWPDADEVVANVLGVDAFERAMAMVRWQLEQAHGRARDASRTAPCLHLHFGSVPPDSWRTLPGDPYFATLVRQGAGRKAKDVDLASVAGLTHEAAAVVLDVSKATVERRRRKARASA
jgi:hypothetical protein